MNVLLIVSCVLLLWIGLRLCESYSPAWIFVLMWTAQLLLSGIVLDSFISFSYSGLIFILMLTFFFTIGALSLPVRATVSCVNGELADKRVKIILVALSILALGNPLMSIVQNGFSLSNFFSLESLLEMGSEMSEKRYAETQEVSMLSQILLIFLYLAALYGGYCFWLGDKIIRILCIIVLLPSVLVSFTQGVKLNLASSVFLFAIGIIVSSFANGKIININFKKLIIGFGGIASFLAILYFSMMFRVGQLDDEAVSMVNQKLSSYTIGHLPCFDIWFSDVRSNDAPLKYGSRTFFAVSNTLGIEKRELGVYSDRITFGKDGFEGESNVYTAFRAMVDDFGFFGSFVFMFVMGYFSQLCLVNSRRWRRSFLSETILCSLYAYVIWSPLTSYFTYLSYIAVFVFFYILLHFTYTNDSVSS